MKHNYNSFQNMVYNGAQPWGHYNPPPLIFALSSVQLYTTSARFSKIFKKMWVLYPHNLFMLPCHVLRTVPGPLDPYKLNSSILELFYFPVQYAHRMHLHDTFWFHLNHIPIDYMISIRYIYFLSNEIWDTLGTVMDAVMQAYMQCIYMYIQTNLITLKLYTTYTTYNK